MINHQILGPDRDRVLSCWRGAVKPLYFLICAALLFSAKGFGFEIKVFPASEVYDRNLDFMHERLGIKGQALKVEDFEDDELESWLHTNLKATNDTPWYAWAGQRASALSDTGEFEIRLPGIRYFGVGLSDDGGDEHLSINGGIAVELKRFQGHERNGSGRAYYVFIAAQPNDPDIRSVVIDQGSTISFDHLVVFETESPLKEEKMAPRLALSLRDGTRLVGYSERDSVAVQADNAKLDLPFARIYSMQCDPRTNHATVLLRNGEKISGELGSSELKVNTSTGRVVLPFQNLRHVQVTPRGEFHPGDACSDKLKSVFHAEEPSYEGKSLREWLRLCGPQPGAGKMYDSLRPASDDDTPTQQHAKEVVRNIGRSSLPFLMELLARGGLDAHFGRQGFAVLGDLAKSALPDLLQLLQQNEGDDITQRSCIIWSIGNIGPAAESAIPALVEELRQSRHPSVAAEALGDIGHAAAEAAPILIERISNGDLPYDLPLIIALGKMHSRDAVPVLVAIAKRTENESRRKHDQPGYTLEMRQHRAVEALGRIGPDAVYAVPSLIELLKVQGSGNVISMYYSDRIIRALGSIGSNAHAAIPVLREIVVRSKKPSDLSQIARVAIAQIEASQ
jgi:hypothetical protein